MTWDATTGIRGHAIAGFMVLMLDEKDLPNEAKFDIYRKTALSTKVRFSDVKISSSQFSWPVYLSLGRTAMHSVLDGLDIQLSRYVDLDDSQLGAVHRTLTRGKELQGKARRSLRSKAHRSS